MEATVATTIQNLPEEIFEIIAQFLTSTDLDACFNVCQTWRCIFNTNKIWKRCCVYPEKYFKSSAELRLRLEKNKANSQQISIWRNYYEHQQTVWTNWNKGQFLVEKSCICMDRISYSVTMVDDNGNHWLFDSGNKNGITVWNITESPTLHCRIKEGGHFGIWPVKDKLLTSRSDYVKVFQFRYPDYEMKLQWSFLFDMNVIMPVDQDISDDHYTCYTRYIVVDNFFIGYSDIVESIHTAYLHIWDLDSARKVVKLTTYQQSFVDFILSATGIDITQDFAGGLLLFESDQRRFLVNIISDKFKKCQISVFSLDEMRFVSLIAQLESRTAWCFMKGDLIAIWHILRSETSQVSVYNVNGQYLAKLDFPDVYNPTFTNEFWFTSSKVVLKVKSRIFVLTVTDAGSVYENDFKTDESQYILGYFKPKFLLLFEKHDNLHAYLSSSSTLVSVWDIESGVILWNLGHLSNIRMYHSSFHDIEYPGKLLVQFTGDTELSVLNFEKKSN